MHAPGQSGGNRDGGDRIGCGGEQKTAPLIGRPPGERAPPPEQQQCDRDK
jgi:hypothetical protein